MNAAPLVSVIVRSMGRATLAAALESIGEQQGITAEVIVVAACGPAHPPIPSSCGPHPVRLVGGEQRLSRPAAANAGLEAARGHWITFLDDDDVLLPGHLAGLTAAAAQAPDARVITSLVRGTLAGGAASHVGHPFSLRQLYERNFTHLSSSLVARELIGDGVRFDETFEILEDWDFMLQLAQRASFHFVPLATFQWNAEAGDSGAGGGANHDATRFTAFRDRIYAKWQAQYEALDARTRPLLERANALARAGQLPEADAACRAVLEISPNDAFALSMLAMVLRQAGRVADARRVQALAAAVRPHDPAFVYNLALLDRQAGDLDAARHSAARAVAIDATFAPAVRLASELAPSAVASSPSLSRS